MFALVFIYIERVSIIYDKLLSLHKVRVKEVLNAVEEMQTCVATKYTVVAVRIDLHVELCALLYEYF